MIKIEILEFVTHLPFTNNKKAPNKYVKLNNQTIYNGAINRFARATLMDNFHHYICKQLKGIKPIKNKHFPISIHLALHAPINYGSVQRRKIKGFKEPQLLWKIPKGNYVANWDVDNILGIWRKAFNDSLTIAGIIPDDSVEYITWNSHEFVEIKDFKDRKIVCTILYNNELKTPF